MVFGQPGRAFPAHIGCKVWGLAHYVWAKTIPGNRLGCRGKSYCGLPIGASGTARPLSVSQPGWATARTVKTDGQPDVDGNRRTPTSSMKHVQPGAEGRQRTRSLAILLILSVLFSFAVRRNPNTILDTQTGRRHSFIHKPPSLNGPFLTIEV
jgi:hypothetical protein